MANYYRHNLRKFEEDFTIQSYMYVLLNKSPLFLTFPHIRCIFVCMGEESRNASKRSNFLDVEKSK